MFVIDLNKKSERLDIKGTGEKGDVLFLAEVGELDENTGIKGINFPYGATGMISLGDGYFYFSKDFTNEDGTRGTVVGLYEFDGNKSFIEK